MGLWLVSHLPLIFYRFMLLFSSETNKSILSFVTCCTTTM